MRAQRQVRERASSASSVRDWQPVVLRMRLTYFFTVSSASQSVSAICALDSPSATSRTTCFCRSDRRASAVLGRETGRPRQIAESCRESTRNVASSARPNLVRGRVEYPDQAGVAPGQADAQAGRGFHTPGPVKELPHVGLGRRREPTERRELGQRRHIAGCDLAHGGGAPEQVVTPPAILVFGQHPARVPLGQWGGVAEHGVECRPGGK